MRGNTVKLHHMLAAPVERVYRAFFDANALAKWLPDGRDSRSHESLISYCVIHSTFRDPLVSH